MDWTKVENIPLHSQHTVMQNGLTVVTMEMPHIHSMELAVFVRCGLRFETRENNGVSHFLEHMMFRGNQVFPDSISLNREFENIGRDLRASTYSDYTYYGFSPHISNLERAMELFAAFFTEPTFAGIDLEREIILEEYQEDLNQEGENIDINNLACQLMYPEDPLSWPTIGTEATIKSIDADVLLDHFRRFYVPENMILAGAGPVDHSGFLILAEKYFSSFKYRGCGVSKNHFEGKLKEDQKQAAFLFQQDVDSQVQLQVCFRSVSYNHPDYFSTVLISHLFDDGVTSRLQKALREDRGLVYSVECRATSLPDTGTVDFDVTVRPEKVCEVASILFREIRSFLDTGPGEEELQKVKKRYSYDLDAERDDPCKQMMRHAFSKLYSRDISVDEEWKLIEGITRKDIWEAAKRIFVGEKLNLILVGPHTPEIEEKLKNYALTF